MASVRLLLACGASVILSAEVSAVPLLPGDILAMGTGSAGTGIVRVDPDTGAQALVAAGDFGDFAIGTAFVYAILGDFVVRIEPLTGLQTTVTSGGLLVAPAGISLGPAGEIFVLETEGLGGQPGIVRVDPLTGAQTPHSVGGLIDSVTLWDLEADPSGDVIVLEDPFGSGEAAELIRVDATSGLQTEIPLVGGLPTFAYALGVATNGDIYISDSGFSGTIVWHLDHETGELTRVGFVTIDLGPDGEADPLVADIALDESGRVLVAPDFVSNGSNTGERVPNGIFEIPFGEGPNRVPLSEGTFGELQIVRSPFVIPEPATAALLLLGLAGIAGFRKRCAFGR